MTNIQHDKSIYKFQYSLALNVSMECRAVILIKMRIWKCQKSKHINVKHIYSNNRFLA